ncbi:hypothetical protein SMA90_26745, partial [Escherichia coli]
QVQIVSHGNTNVAIFSLPLSLKTVLQCTGHIRAENLIYRAPAGRFNWPDGCKKFENWGE